jgi:peptide/nickel transport system substrate-binding protein
VKGGVLRIVSAASFPKVLGLQTEMAPADNIYALPALERLIEWDEKGNFVPVLAEKWTGDPQAMTITWTLRKGVKFTDGTDWNAEALRWNFQRGIDAKRLTDYQFVKSLEVVDPYTIKMNLNNYTSLMFRKLRMSYMSSPTAWRRPGNTDDEQMPGLVITP